MSKNIVTFVQDGLVFWLDGLDGDSNKWVDKIGGVEFVNHGAIKSEHGYILNGSSQYLKAAVQGLFPASSYTIEVVLRSHISDSGVIFGNGYDLGNMLCMFKVYQNRYAYGHGTAYKIFQPLMNNPLLLSANLDIAISNKTQATFTNDSSSYSVIEPNMIIGARYYNGSYGTFWGGEICDIRIYNRKLTLAEIMHNQNVAINRYNLTI